MNKILRNFKYIVLVLVTILLAFSTKVNAYSGEIDPNDYITLPIGIMVKGNMAEGDVLISSLAGNDYSLYYQFLKLTEAQFNEIIDKVSIYSEKMKNVRAEYEEQIITEKNKVDKAKEDYNTINGDSSKTAEEKKNAKQEYERIAKEYNEKLNELDTKCEQDIEQLMQEFLSYVPTFNENDWIQTTNKTIETDISEFAGKVYLLAWVKLVNPTGTYYDYSLYATSGTKVISLSLDKTTAEIEVGKTLQLIATTNSNKTVSWSSNNENVATVDNSGVVTGVAEGVATITAEVEGKKATCVVTVKRAIGQGGEENKDGLQWTDFSNAHITLEKDENGIYFIIVKGVNLLANGNDINERYNIFITMNKDYTPELEKECGYGIENWRTVNSNKSASLYDSNSEIGLRVAEKLYEQAGEKLYVWIREMQYDNAQAKYVYKYRVKAIEINRLPQRTLGTRITGDFINDKTVFFLRDYYDTSSNNKTIKYKIGKVTDIEILRSIKNGESGCLNKLLEYAKNASNGYTGSAPLGQSNEITSKLNLEDKAYYYVYMELDTENGKYYPIEDISLYQAIHFTSKNEWGLYDYLSDKFVWNIENNNGSQQEDNTTSKDNLPNTGATIAIIASSLIIVAFGIYGFIRTRNMKEI